MALAVAVVAGLGATDGQFLLDALVGLLEVDGHRRPEVLALLGAAPTPTAAEELVEDVLHAAEAATAERVATGTAAAAPADAAVFLGLFEALVADLVV